MKRFTSIIALMVLSHFGVLNAQTATLTGIVFDEGNRPMANVNVASEKYGTITDVNGFYLLQITADIENRVIFSHIGHKEVILEKLILTTNETFEFNPVMKTSAIQIDGVTVTPTGQKSVDGITTIPHEVVLKIPGANAGVENILKLLPGVSSNNELSTQYSVRGGNYDENLVYVNEIEVYRPFLIRSAQQEGLSFVNSEMVQQIKFSPGGFQAKYGDKLSSVLDITYKIPTKTRAHLDLGFLGASATVESISKNKAFTNVTGVRYRNNAILVNSQQTNSNFKPLFFDAQTYASYRFSKKFQLGILGNLSINDYRNQPIDRQTNFGTFSDPRALIVRYDGEENNKYKTALAAIKGIYRLNDHTSLKLVSTIFHTLEEERSDVISNYRLGQIDTDLGSESLGEVTTSKGIGAQFDRARNRLDGLITNTQLKGVFTKNEKTFEWGASFAHEDIRDQIREAEFIDSLGFSVRPPLPQFTNAQPEVPFTADLVPFESVAARNFIKVNRFSAFAQFSERKDFKGNTVFYNIGIRGQHWRVYGQNVASSAQMVLSPRAQLAIKPNWQKDMVFRFSVGVYQQPPFYRELRNAEGTVIPTVKAQRATHFVLGNEYSLTLWNRPFTLFGETYYKLLDNVNPYTLDDVRIRYLANNEATAYVYGAELRLNGAFVPGTESWVSLGFLKTEENRANRGYIARPTDQRLKLGILFQDYIPTIPDVKMYLNLVYQTGAPGGSPSYADPYVFQNRLRDYKRADLGISYIFANAGKPYSKGHWLHGLNELSVGFEVFNLFNNQNSITNTWVRDVEDKQQYAVPNFLTGRVLNLRLKTGF